MVAWLLVFLLGMSSVWLIAKNSSWLIKLGLAMPVGMGISSVLMFLLNLAGFQINNPTLLLFCYMLVTCVFIFFIIKQKKIQSFYIPNWRQLLPLNVAWLLLVGIIIYVLYVLSSKAMFWPAVNYDAVSGYDLMAKIIATEGHIHNSIFNTENSLQNIRTNYPPLYSLNLAFAYIMGAPTSKIVSVFFYISLAVAFYALVRHYVSHFAAALFTLLLIVTPEFAGFSALLSNNPPAAFYGGLGFLLIFLWFDKENPHFFWLGILMLCLGLWTRNETIFFAAGSGLLVLMKTIKDKNWGRLFSFALPIFMFVLVWQLYLKIELHAESSVGLAENIAQWKGSKWATIWEQVKNVTFKSQYYGIVVYLFFVAVLINIKNIFVNKDMPFFLLSLMLAWLLYLLLFYVLDIDLKSSGWIVNSYKRGFFAFIPVLIFYVATNRLSQKLFNQIIPI